MHTLEILKMFRKLCSLLGGMAHRLGERGTMRYSKHQEGHGRFEFLERIQQISNQQHFLHWLQVASEESVFCCAGD